ncbi:MAG: NPCBM/NEW2 domain-containing protein, partial [Bryobacteraceae bacterium]|nr:NPCBM/NEW2 domain-containing protein [Bryobacteraceae bacterium]
MRNHSIGCVAALCILSVSVQGQNNGTGLRGQYFSTRDLTGAVALERTDPGLEFQWGQGSPGGAIPADKFSVRWSGQLEAPASGEFTIATVSDDGVRLWLDGKLRIDDWYNHGALRNQTRPLALTAGKKYNLRIEYYENTGNSSIKLLWTYPGQAEQAIPKTRLYPAPIPFTEAPPPAGRTMLSDLPFLAQSNGLGPVERNRANGGAGEDDGKSISIGGYRWGSGVGMHAPGAVTIALDDRFDVFRAMVGVDDEVGDAGSVVFEVWVDGVKKFSSPVMKGSMPPLAVEVPVENARQLRLVAGPGPDGNKGDSASWAYARLEGKETVRYLSDMKWLSATNGLGPVERDNANGGAGENDGGKIQLRGEVYRKGLGLMSPAKIVYDLDGRYELFSAVAGIDDAAKKKGSAVFEAWSGTKLLYRSPTLKGTDSPRHVAIPVKGVEELTLKVLDGGDGSDGDFADWADAKLLLLGSDIPAGVMPAPPTSLTAAGGDGLVKLKWNASANTVSYSVWRSTEPNDATPQTIETNLLTTSYVDDGARNGVKYYYRVVGVNPNGKGAPSNEASATPMAPLPAPPASPANLTAKPGNAEVLLAWQASQGAASYTLYRGLSSTTLAAVASSLKGTTYTDSKLTNGTTYFYHVVAVNAGGSSKPSNQVSAKPVAPELPPAPTGLTATGGTGQITLNWTGVSSALSYNIYRGTAANGQGASPIASGVKATTFIDKGLTNGT